MKTIQISDETYDFIKNLAQEMKEQNNRGTQYAYSENARSYGISNWRNDEMCKLQRAIFEFAGIEKPIDY